MKELVYGRSLRNSLPFPDQGIVEQVGVEFLKSIILIPIFTKDDQFLNEVLKLAHVARPLQFHELVEMVLGNG